MKSMSFLHFKIIAIHRFHQTLEMPMDKAIAGEGKGWIQVKPGIFGFTWIFQNLPWAKTNIIIAYPDIIIANIDTIIANIANGNMLMINPLSAINRWAVSY